MSSEVSVGRWTPKITATYARPADNTAYAVGDIIGNSGTAASVVPITFSNVARSAGGSGRILGARCTVVAASGTIVLPAFDLLLFRPVTDIPFAAAGYPADNAALLVSGAAMKELLAVVAFASTTWRNQAGGTSAAGTGIWQATRLSVPAPFNLLSLSSPPGSADGGGRDLVGLLQAQNTWTPTGVINSFEITLEVEQD